MRQKISQDASELLVIQIEIFRFPCNIGYFESFI